MISIIAFIIVMFGSLNWLSIGFFQYDLVAGLFGYQGSIFSRIVYIIVGISAIYLTYSVIKHKGKISVKKLMKEEQIKAPINTNENKNEENFENTQNQNLNDYDSHYSNDNNANNGNAQNHNDMNRNNNNFNSNNNNYNFNSNNNNNNNNNNNSINNNNNYNNIKH